MHDVDRMQVERHLQCVPFSFSALTVQMKCLVKAVMKHNRLWVAVFSDLGIHLVYIIIILLSMMMSCILFFFYRQFSGILTLEDNHSS